MPKLVFDIIKQNSKTLNKNTESIVGNGFRINGEGFKINGEGFQINGSGAVDIAPKKLPSSFRDIKNSNKKNNIRLIL